MAKESHASDHKVRSSCNPSLFFRYTKRLHPQMVGGGRGLMSRAGPGLLPMAVFLSRPILASLVVETNEGNWVARTDVLAAPTKQRLQIWTKIGNNGRKRKSEKAEKMTRRPEGDEVPFAYCPYTLLHLCNRCVTVSLCQDIILSILIWGNVRYVFVVSKEGVQHTTFSNRSSPHTGSPPYPPESGAPEWAWAGKKRSVARRSGTNHLQACRSEKRLGTIGDFPLNPFGNSRPPKNHNRACLTKRLSWNYASPVSKFD